ncbi:kinesin-like protein KIFC3, partial [Plectropomus leopardus]|uniref:kinesin-like protein KIFC3 n=1 Tax=Plectropomus leopardus TaxID=160734 RepID=UPI001C4B7697
GATDLEKQLELLVVENQRLKQELKSCRSSDAAAESCSCSHCPHSQDAESLRREVSRWESQARQRERRLAELERELLEKTSRVDSLRLQLDESTRQLEDGRRQLEESKRRQGDAEHKLSLRLQECEEELARQAATPPRVKYVTQTVEVESADSQRALAELQTKNAGLQEQLSAQRQLLRELETQLHESQRTCAQLRTQLLADRSRLCALLSKAVGRGNSEVVRRLSK